MLNAISTFKKNNEEWERVQVIMVDKDLTEIKVLEDEFPRARVLICHFHVLKYFRTVTANAKYGLNQQRQSEVLLAVQDMVYAKDDYTSYDSEMLNVLRIASQHAAELIQEQYLHALKTLPNQSVIPLNSIHKRWLLRSDISISIDVPQARLPFVTRINTRQKALTEQETFSRLSVLQARLTEAVVAHGTSHFESIFRTLEQFVDLVVDGHIPQLATPPEKGLPQGAMNSGASTPTKRGAIVTGPQLQHSGIRRTRSDLLKPNRVGVSSKKYLNLTPSTFSAADSHLPKRFTCRGESVRRRQPVRGTRKDRKKQKAKSDRKSSAAEFEDSEDDDSDNLVDDNAQLSTASHQEAGGLRQHRDHAEEITSLASIIDIPTTTSVLISLYQKCFRLKCSIHAYDNIIMLEAAMIEKRDASRVNGEIVHDVDVDGEGIDNICVEAGNAGYCFHSSAITAMQMFHQRLQYLAAASSCLNWFQSHADEIQINQEVVQKIVDVLRTTSVFSRLALGNHDAFFYDLFAFMDGNWMNDLCIKMALHVSLGYRKDTCFIDTSFFSYTKPEHALLHDAFATSFLGVSRIWFFQFVSITSTGAWYWSTDE
ncbi:hypothetical protein PHYSODRAFT_295077 [Phytophthora sojae]|uniref:ZSWIM1/3 RNaseH-like domain-containing protein n=1 Tax=Phytophthora sojae (strain P6497) TaxID=1094619 RepID=G4YND8_PHYSP|nr:hypothetical protein PHYSODRAFT_295077 [Phytophthora sojae]EGZ30231.1 hypothetical protein PHYSODRAFT_295077 [Phytophthora sojae]|eukprot:XP_009517506.1 hypothetical protein PHYSODRAFT_295077 [Phytophthora sojae]